MSVGGCGRVSVSLKIGDTNDKKNLWARKSRALAARITMSASSAQKTVDNGTGVVVVVMGTSDDMVECGTGEISLRACDEDCG